MVEENILVNIVGNIDMFQWVVILLIITSFMLFYRVLFGPTLADRIVGLNTITTKIVVVIALFSAINNQFAFIDLAIVLLMVNAVGGLILSKHFERRKECV